MSVFDFYRELHSVKSVCSSSFLTFYWHQKSCSFCPMTKPTTGGPYCTVIDSSIWQAARQESLKCVFNYRAAVNTIFWLGMSVELEITSVAFFYLAIKTSARDHALLWPTCTHLWSTFRRLSNTESHFWGILFTVPLMWLMLAAHAGSSCMRSFPCVCLCVCVCMLAVAVSQLSSNEGGKRRRWTQCTGEDSSAAGCMDETH